MSEITYYEDSAVQVSSEWVKLGGKVYPVDQIESVRIRSAQSDIVRDLPYLLMIVGSITTFILLNIQRFFPREWEDLMPKLLLFGLATAVIGLAILMAQSLFKVDYLYAVRLSGSFGHACPFASDDARYVKQVVSAINNAIGYKDPEYAQEVAIDINTAVRNNH